MLKDKKKKKKKKKKTYGLVCFFDYNNFLKYTLVS